MRSECPDTPDGRDTLDAISLTGTQFTTAPYVPTQRATAPCVQTYLAPALCFKTHLATALCVQTQWPRHMRLDE